MASHDNSHDGSPQHLPRRSERNINKKQTKVNPQSTSGSSSKTVNTVQNEKHALAIDSGDEGGAVKKRKKGKSSKTAPVKLTSASNVPAGTNNQNSMLSMDNVGHGSSRQLTYSTPLSNDHQAQANPYQFVAFHGRPEQYHNPSAEEIQATQRRGMLAERFPDGFVHIATTNGTNVNNSGYLAIIFSVEAQYKKIAPPTHRELLEIYTSWEIINPVLGYIGTGSPDNIPDLEWINLFGCVLSLWGRLRGLDLQLGYVTKADGQAHLASAVYCHERWGARREIIWIGYNDNHHFSGIMEDRGSHLAESGINFLVHHSIVGR